MRKAPLKDLFQEGFDCFLPSYLIFKEKIKDSEVSNTQNLDITSNPPSAVPNSANSLFSLNDFIADIEENPTYNEELNNIEIKNDITSETTELIKVFKDNDFLKEKFTSHQFWFKYESKFKLLSQLALILLNIPSSSAFIERFFSICGVICNKRSLNIGDDLLITRSLLKANIKLLNEISINENEKNEI
jgi:hypothetical protein